MDLEKEDFYAYAIQTWQSVDMPNYMANVEPVRSQADIVLNLDKRHEVQQIRLQSSYQIKRGNKHGIFDE